MGDDPATPCIGIRRPGPSSRRFASRFAVKVAVGIALGIACLCGTSAAAQPAESPEPEPTARRPVDAQRIRAADREPANWLAHGRTHDEQRYSPLAQIGPKNIATLGLAWSYATGTRRGLEATPLVADGVLYATGSWSVVFALDASNGRELWRYDPEVPRWKGRHACCDVVNRGVALWGDKVFLGTLDGRLIALDAATGKVVWQTLTVDPGSAYTITGAPRVVKGRVIIGNGGADLGVRGYFGAYSAETGELLWRFYTVPGSADGPHEHPELELAAQTWSPDSAWETGLGGTVWDSFAYDPELDLLYAGVGNSSLYDRSKRSPGGGDNLFLTAILAVRPETGRLVWHYQTTPGEAWDYTATQHMILADLEIGGRLRQVIMQAPKNGFFYVLDRATGELLSAEPYVDVSWASHVDRTTGRPVERAEADWTEHAAYVTPGVVGGHNWHPMAFSPRTGLVYIPSISSAYRYSPDKDYVFLPGTWNTGEDMGALTAEFEDFADLASFCSPSHITAWDPRRGKAAWRVVHKNAVPGGLLVTASDLLFQGTGSGVFAAYNAHTGERLWSAKTGGGIMAPPISYTVNGEQYIAVLAGMGGVHGGHFMQFEHDNAGQLLAWKIAGQAKMPVIARRPRPTIEAPLPRASAAKINRGRDLYGRHCSHCHGIGLTASGLYPDLQRASRQTHTQWNAIVLGGTRQAGGMPSFADLLTAADAQAIRAYAIDRSRAEYDWLTAAGRMLLKHVCIPASLVAD